MIRFTTDRRELRDRRQKPTRPFTRYMLLGRRRAIRRRADRKTHIYVDIYAHYLLLFLLLIVLLSIVDAYFTIFHVDQGAQEINPFMNFLIGYGSIHFFIVKYILTILGLVLLCLYQSLPVTRTIILCILFFYLTVFANHIFLILRR